MMIDRIDREDLNKLAQIARNLNTIPVAGVEYQSLMVDGIVSIDRITKKYLQLLAAEQQETEQEG